MDKLLFLTLTLFSFSSFSQDLERQNIYYGNVAYDNENYEEAINYYSEALVASPLSYKAHYNMANAYFREKNFQKSADLYASIIDLAPTAFDKSKVYHNLGNSHFLNQKLDDASDAYKSALRLNPSDEETRYNLAYALLLKQQQPPQQNENENQSDENENQSDKQNENDKQNESDKQNQSDKQNESDKQNQSDKQNEKNGGNKSQPSKMSKEEIRRILDAAYRREKEVQGKIEKQKIVGEGTSSKKDW